MVSKVKGVKLSCAVVHDVCASMGNIDEAKQRLGLKSLVTVRRHRHAKSHLG